MNVEFLIHGTLSAGQSSWKDTDADFCRRFYVDSRQESVVMDVEVFNQKTYYTYLRYNNVSVMQRNGSYFGITVRVDGCACTDAKGMFNILDSLFHKRIVGSILSVKDNKYVYSINSSFKEKDEELKLLENIFLKLFSATFFSKDDYIEVKSAASNGKQVKCFCLEATQQTVADTLRSGGKISLSPEYPSKYSEKVIQAAEQAKQEAYAAMKASEESANARVKAAEDKAAATAKTIEQKYQQTVSTLTADKNALAQQLESTKQSLQNEKNEVGKLKTQLQNTKNNTDINQKIEQIRRPLFELVELMKTKSVSMSQQGGAEQRAPQNRVGTLPVEKKKTKDGIFDRVPKVVLYGGLFVLVVLIVYFLCSFFSGTTDDVTAETNSTPVEIVAEKPQEYKIDIEGCEGDKISKNKSYKLSVVTAEGEVVEGGVFSYSTDAHADFKDIIGEELKYTDDGESVTIRFVMNGNEIVTREVHVEQQGAAE